MPVTSLYSRLRGLAARSRIQALRQGLMGEIESRLSRSYSAIASRSQFLRSCARLGALRTKSLWDDGCDESTTVASISALPGDEESVNTPATMPQRPHRYKAGTLFSRYRLSPTPRRFLVSHSISVSIHSLICSAISQWLFAHSPCSSLSYLPRNALLPLHPLLPLMSSRRILSPPFLEPAHHPTALPRR